MGRVRVEVRLHVVPRVVDFLARDAQRLRDVAELVLAESAEVIGDDLLRVRRHRLADLLEMLDLHEQAFARVARADAPRLDRHDRAQCALGVLERDLHRLRRVLERHSLEPAAVIDVADEVFGGRVQPRRQHHAHVPREIVGKRLLRLGADDRIELVVVVVTLHETGTFERLGLHLVRARRFVRQAEAVEADAALKRLTAQRTDLALFEIERRVLLQLGVDHVLQLDRRELKDVVRGDLLRCDLELHLWKDP